MADLIPPDYGRCQAFPNMLSHGPFSLGPRPEPVQCDAEPVWLAREVVPGSDGLCGSMTLCQSCVEQMGRTMLRRVKLRPINRKAR